MQYSSRSRLEHFGDCQRLGYLRYLWDGRGITRRGISVYLSTGSYTHLGLEEIFRWVRRCGQQLPDQREIDYACQLATEAYKDEIQKRGFDLEEGENKEFENYVVNEQCALVEAFIRAFSIRILPDLLRDYRVVDVEREEYIIDGDLIIEGKIDVILERLVDGDVFIISFKTAASWDRRQEKANEHDNQGLSESYILESRLRLENRAVDEVTVHNREWAGLLPPKGEAAAKKFVEYVEKFRKPDKVMGVLMIYFIKGRRYETQKGSGRWEQHCPLIRGYRKLVGTEYEYASSLWYPKPENASGWGKLGKGWEAFNVWESEEVGGIKGWLDKIVNGQVGEADIIGESFIIPAPYFRNSDEMQNWYEQSVASENRISEAAGLVDSVAGQDSFKTMLNVSFPQRRKHCHYPVDCSFIDVCFNPTIFDDPIGSGLYVYRTPHHQLELQEHERLYQISKEVVIDLEGDIVIDE